MREICLLLSTLLLSCLAWAQVEDCGNIMVAGYNQNLSWFGVDVKAGKLVMCDTFRKEIDSEVWRWFRVLKLIAC